MILSDEQVRAGIIGLFKAPTDRDQQTTIGASNMSNQCDRCLAHEMLGNPRTSVAAERAWMGARLGTGIHGHLEGRLNHFTGVDASDEIERQRLRRILVEVIGLPASCIAETHTFFADLRGYGPVGGTVDIQFTDEHIGDYKGSTRQKLCLLIDWLAIQRGEEPIFGRKHKYMALFEEGKDGVFRKVVDQLSEKEYAAEMAHMGYKVSGYYGQTQLYMKGKRARRSSLIFIARDGTGVFDNPAGMRYDDPKAIHDIHILSFDYDEAYADALIARAQAIWDNLESGVLPNDLNSHPLCYFCETEAKDLSKVPAVEATFPAPAAA